MHATPLPTLQLHELCGRRGERLLFEHVSARLSAGSAMRLHGANGRGKTSLLRIVCGLSRPERGLVRWGERTVLAPGAYGGRLLHIGHAPALKADETPALALTFLARIGSHEAAPPQVQAALARVNLGCCADQCIRGLSQGQRKRVALARLALAQGREPALWLLDEPFDGLDEQGIEIVNDLLAEHLKRGGSALVASHTPLAPALGATGLDLDRHAPALQPRTASARTIAAQPA